jgi:Flp pilus assembly protein TadD
MKVGKHHGGAGRADWRVQAENLFSRPLIISLLLAMTTLLVYWPVQKYDFLGYDDPLYFTQNLHVLGGWSWSNVGWAFTTGAAANWHPLTWLSLMLDAEIFGNQPAGPHLVNLLLHLANTILLFHLLHRLTAAAGRSALVAALFALHPLHVESVAWVAERKDLLCGFFVLLTLLAYAKAVGAAGQGATPAARRRVSFYILSLVCFALALMSKPMAVTLPCLLLLLDWWPLKRMPGFQFSLSGAAKRPEQITSFNSLLVEKIPFLVLSVAASVVTFIVQKNGDAVAGLTMYPLPVRFENVLVSYARYLAKTIWPAALANPYPHPGHWPATAVIFSGLLFAGLCVVAVGCARRFPFVFTGWFWFAGMLVPVIGLVQVGTQAMADRYMYLPSIGLFVAFVWGLAQLAGHWNFPKILTTVAALALLAGNAARTRDQLGYWQNDGTLFTHALAVTSDNCTASIDLGSWYLKNGQNQAALDQYHAALKMHPADPLVLYDLGNAFASLGNYDEAVGDYRRALQFAPGRPNILNNLGCALVAQNQLPEAITNFEAALAAQPNFAYAHNGLAAALFKSGRFDDAARHFYEASKLEPDNPEYAANLGDALVRLGRPEAAAECYRRALQLEPGDPDLTAKLNSLATPPAK